MDYMKFVNYHRESQADVTIGCIAYGSDRAKEFGLMKIDDKRRVVVRPQGGRAAVASGGACVSARGGWAVPGCPACPCLPRCTCTYI